MRSRTRIVIVDDHEAIVEMMTLVIESMPGYVVVGHAADAVQAVETCRRERPDLLILDLVLPKGSGLMVQNRVKEFCPLVRVLVFSGNLWPTTLRGVLAAGVHGVVDKMSSLTELRTAIQAVSEGRVYFTPSVSAQIMELVHRRMGAAQFPAALSAREKAILRHLAEGASVKEVAAALDLSPYTVVNHRVKLMRKIGLRSAAQLSLYAAQIGLIGEPGSPAAIKAADRIFPRNGDEVDGG
jgi:DNA-binding NarL/FixJ family response regulator